jgi:hypothetical protein
MLNSRSLARLKYSLEFKTSSWIQIIWSKKILVLDANYPCFGFQIIILIWIVEPKFKFSFLRNGLKLWFGIQILFEIKFKFCSQSFKPNLQNLLWFKFNKAAAKIETHFCIPFPISAQLHWKSVVFLLHRPSLHQPSLPNRNRLGPPTCLLPPAEFLPRAPSRSNWSARPPSSTARPTRGPTTQRTLSLMQWRRWLVVEPRRCGRRWVAAPRRATPVELWFRAGGWWRGGRGTTLNMGGRWHRRGGRTASPMVWPWMHTWRAPHGVTCNPSRVWRSFL